MDYDLIQSLGSAIDNVYSYSSEDGSRKTIAKLSGNCMNISYITILNSTRNDLHEQTSKLNKEADEMIKSRLKTIKEEFKRSSKRELDTNKISDKNSFETLTVSPYSLIKKLMFRCTYTYEVK